MLDFVPVREDDGIAVEIDVLTLVLVSYRHVSGLGFGRGSYLVIYLQVRRFTLTLILQRTIHQHAMHILPMKHVVGKTPSLFVVIQIVDADTLASLPVPIDQLLQYHRIALCDIDVPLMEPSRSISSTRYRCSDFAGKVIPFIHGDPVTCAPKGNGSR